MAYVSYFSELQSTSVNCSRLLVAWKYYAIPFRFCYTQRVSTQTSLHGPDTTRASGSYDTSVNDIIITSAFRVPMMIVVKYQSYLLENTQTGNHSAMWSP